MASAAAKPVASAAPPASPAPAAALKAAAALSRSRLKASPSVEVLGLLQQGLAADPAARWQTERGQGPYGAAQRLWLLQLQQATAGLWREAVSDPGHPATVQWSLREGGQADISLADAVWLRWKGVTYTAPLSDATAYALRRLSEDWH
jgi:hypothetical protein